MTPFAYDSDNNFLGDTLVTWGVTGDLSLSNLSSQSSRRTVYSPTIAGKTGLLTAYYNSNISDSTGLINVINPPIISYVTGSIKPKTISTSSKPSFELKVENIGDVGVILDTTTKIVFTDGVNIFSS